jgi:uncharacterized integral membrane protein
MTRITHSLHNRNLLYALSALPPVIFLLMGHVLLGVLFLACVVGGRFSRSRPSPRSQTYVKPTGS